MGGVHSGGRIKREKKDASSGFSGKLRSVKSIGRVGDTGTANDFVERTTMPQRYNSGESMLSFSRELKPSTPARAGGAGKANQKSSFIGKAGAVGLEKAVEVLDTLGSTMSNLNARGGFVSSMNARGNRLSILAFEVANTIAKGANLFQSLSEENVKHLKEEILPSEGVRELVSTDMEELLVIAASDKREELAVFSREVVRFGDQCKDPQWHNLDRYFSKLDSEISNDKQSRAEAEITMHELTTLAQHTSELYHELNAMDRFEQDYHRKCEELQSLHLPQKGECLSILQSELKGQRKIVRSLKKKSLWSKKLEEIIEKLIDIVTYLHQAILDAFGNNGITSVNEEPSKNAQRLGTAGLALHYANIINQIDNIVSRPTSLPSNTRDSLYHGLPASVKAALRSRLQMADVNEEITVADVKAELEKVLQWLVPMATNTTKVHQGFGWVGEWANTVNEFGKTTSANSNPIRLQTLYHASKQKTDKYILDLVTWLISLVRHRDNGFKAVRFVSPTRKGLIFGTEMQQISSRDHGTKTTCNQLSQEDRDLLAKVRQMRLVPGRSRSQQLITAEKNVKVCALSRSAESSPARVRRRNSEYLRTNILDVMDGLSFKS